MHRSVSGLAWKRDTGVLFALGRRLILPTSSCRIRPSTPFFVSPPRWTPFCHFTSTPLHTLIRSLHSSSIIHRHLLNCSTRSYLINFRRNGTKTRFQGPRHWRESPCRQSPCREEGGWQEDRNPLWREEEAHQDQKGDLLLLHLQR